MGASTTQGRQTDSPLPCPVLPADARALWLQVVANNGAAVVLATPPSSNLLLPGMYMLVLNTASGIPSQGHILSVHVRAGPKGARAMRG